MLGGSDEFSGALPTRESSSDTVRLGCAIISAICTQFVWDSGGIWFQNSDDTLHSACGAEIVKLERVNLPLRH